jgi:4-amino-4-deoxy-L-arabinose transferase-like glycosyltransferase
LVQANAATRSLGRDQGFYVYIGNEIVHGRLPYADAWESKPPAIFYLNALGIWLARGSRWGVWVVELLFLIAALYLSYEFMKRLWGIWPAIFGTALWLYGLDRTFYGGGNFTEEYPLPLHFLAIALMTQLFKAPGKRLYSFALGILFAVAFLFRPNNAAVEAAVVLAVLIAWISRRQYRELAIGLACMALGAAIPFLITLALLLVKGSIAGVDRRLDRLSHGVRWFIRPAPVHAWGRAPGYWVGSRGCCTRVFVHAL